MSPEGERAAEAREWLAKAALDLRGARIDLAAEPPLLEAFRYPGAPPVPDVGEARAALEVAERVVRRVVAGLPTQPT